MKRIFLILLASVLLCSLAAQGGNRWYVIEKEVQGKDGLSWATASNDLQDIINKASSGDEIWVAKGTYLPIRPANDYSGLVDSTNRNNAFVINKDIKLYGGFNGNETAVNERSWYEKKTILSGDLESNDSKDNPASTNDNAYHVVIVNSAGIASLDGFIISGGNANGSSTINVDASTIDHLFGGGIYNDSSNSSLTNLIITDNSATNGGGMYINNLSAATLTNLFVVKNSATNGGGFFMNHSSPTFTSLTVADNIAIDGSEMVNNNSSQPSIRNTIIWNSGSNITNSNDGTNPEYRYSLVKGITDSNNGNIEGTTNPMFIDASSYFLSLISPLIDKGNNQYYQSGETPDISYISTDITNRPRMNGASIDIGAYEYQGTSISVTPNANGILYVNKSVSGGTKDGSSWDNALPRLCDALKASEALNYSTPEAVKQIWVAQGTYYSVHKSAEVDSNGNFTTMRDNAFSLVKDVLLYGGFSGIESSIDQRDWKSNATILSGDFNNDDNINDPTTMKDNAFHVVISAGEMGSALIDGFTISGGYADTDKFVVVNGIRMYSAGGSGLYIENSSPVVSNLLIKDNVTTYRGGGLLLVESSSEISNITITNNRATYGGGGAYIQESNPNMVNIAITNNSAGSGAGMVNRESSSIITNMLIANNTATNDGGGLYNHNSSPTYTNITITNNSATLGGGMYNGGISMPIGRNSILWGNSGGLGVYSETGSENISSYCLVEGETEDGSNGNIAGNTNPLFIGGDNYRLSPASPLSNRGNNIYFQAGEFPDLSNIIADLDGNPRILHSTVDIGAYESDNTSNEADLQNLYINGVLHDINQTYVIPCDYNRDVVDIELEIPANASINIEKVFSLNVSVPSLYKVDFTITSLDSRESKSYTIAIEKYFPFNDITIQKWNNTLAVNNNSSINGGHAFIAYTWYKNGVEVSNKPYYSAGNSPSDLLSESDVFNLVLTKDNGDILPSCPGNITLKRSQAVVYPNPVRVGTQFYLKIDTNENTDSIHDGVVEIFNLSGLRLSSTKIQNSSTPLIIQGAPGVYIVKLKTQNVSESIKVIVQ